MTENCNKNNLTNNSNNNARSQQTKMWNILLNQINLINQLYDPQQSTIQSTIKKQSQLLINKINEAKPLQSSPNKKTQSTAKQLINQFASSLNQFLLICSNNYYYENNRQIIPDDNYDFLFDFIKQLEQYLTHKTKQELITNIIAPASESAAFEKIPHLKPMLSLHKAYDINELISFFKQKTALLSQKSVNNIKKEFYIFESKIDGLSLTCRYSNHKLISAATRGDGFVGENVTANITAIKEIPTALPDYMPLECEVRGEIYLTYKTFEEINQTLIQQNKEPFKNSRNAAAGSLRQKNPQISNSRKLNFIVHGFASEKTEEFFENENQIMSVLKHAGFNINPLRYSFDNIENGKVFLNNLNSIKNKLEYLIDGAVIKINNIAMQNQLGSLSRIPRWAISYKYKNTEAKTTLTNITLQVGRTGQVTPIAIIKPCSIGGATIKRINLHNQDYINQLNLKINDPVKVTRAGDVIPQITANLNFNANLEAFKIPLTCPSCNKKLIRKKIAETTKSKTNQPTKLGSSLMCVNNFNCEKQAINRLIHFCSKSAMNIVGFSNAQIDKFYTEGIVKNYASIFTLKQKLVNNQIKLESFGNYRLKSKQNLIKSIEASRTIKLNKFIYALGLPNIGERNAEILAELLCSIDNFVKLCELIVNENKKITEKHQPQPDLFQSTQIDNNDTSLLAQLSNHHNIGPTIVSEIKNYLSQKDNYKAIITVEKYLTVQDFKPLNLTNTQISNLKICFTGKMDNMKRDKATHIAKQLGAKIVSSVSSNTDILVSNETSSNKISKAQKLNVEIITEAKWLSIIAKYGYS